MPVKKHKKPTYDLEEIKELLDNPLKCHITERAYDDAIDLGFAGDNDIIKEVQKLTHNEFDETAASDRKPGLMHDVYKTTWRGKILYIKLRKSPSGQGVVISFHES